MKTQAQTNDTRIRFRRLPALATPTQPQTRSARLPFLDLAAEEATHDLMVLNLRPDLAEAPEPADLPPPRGAYFEIMLA